MPTIKLGQVRPVYRGVWSEEASDYIGYDWVRYNGAAYLALQNVPVNYEPDSQPDFWVLFGGKGEDGVPGTDGAPGADGQDGAPGIPGIPGPQGVVGNQGIVGPAGPQGPQGPQGLQGAPGTMPELNNTVTSTSTTQAATANAVKMAYDRGTEGVNAAGTAQTAADAAQKAADKAAQKAETSCLSGSILAFSGTFGGSDGKRPIPRGGTTADEGWALCDGSNGTPDLRDRFIVGARGKYAAGAKGGVETHSHAVSGNVGATTLNMTMMPAHAHDYQKDYSVKLWTDIGPNSWNALSSTASTSSEGGSQPHTHSGTFSTVASSNLPPYYALTYIMKL